MKQTICVILSVMLLFLSSCAVTSTSGEELTKSDLSVTSLLSDSENDYKTTFGHGEISGIRVTISEEDWASLLENAKDEEYYPADITVNGTSLKNVGFRTKGFSSLTSVFESGGTRYGFKIKTDEYVDGQTLNGLDMFVLNGSFSDPSYLREYLTYMASAVLDCDTPYLSFVRFYLNDELFGFYLMVESYDDSFVERVCNADEKTVLYKADTETCTLLPEDDASGFDVNYGVDDGCTHVKELITKLNAVTSDNTKEIEEILDVDSVLKAIAVNLVMGNYDSYSGSKAHNYYLLYNKGKFTYLGWD